MRAQRPHPPCEQLTLALWTADPAERLALTAERLSALNRALRFLLDVADGRDVSDLGPGAGRQLQESLDILAAFNLGGRLGHVVRRFRAHAPTAESWREFEAELAFAVSLYQGEPTP